MRPTKISELGGSMKTVVAETVMLGREAFETLGEVEVVADRAIGSKHLRDADALIIRSKTKITSERLAGSSVRFVGTATAGFEHIDFQGLEKSNIEWCASPGCNADSVADYIMTALLSLRIELKGKTLGVIGVGQVGSRVARRAKALGLRVLLNDPPRAMSEGQEMFQSLEELLAHSDIVTLHVPLTTAPPWPTLRMGDRCFFEKMKPGSILINASRGSVLDSSALFQAKESGTLTRIILDVWDPEPEICTDLLNLADIGTAHIAGHSLEGKLNGTLHVYREACEFFNLKPDWNCAPLLPAVDVPELKIDTHGKTDQEVLAEAVLGVYDIAEDDRALRSAPETFDTLRANYRVRREFSNTRIVLSEDRHELKRKVHTLGFQTLKKISFFPLGVFGRVGG